MRAVGWVLFVLGAGYLLVAFNMAVTVGYDDVVNLELLSRRQNHLIVAALVTMLGAIMGIFGGGRADTRPAVEPVNEPIPPAEFVGERQLSSDPYRLWLAAKYEIGRNEVFDRFVMNEQTFVSLDAALAEAHNIEVREAQARKINDVERAARLAARQEEMRLAAEEDKARWREQQPKLIVGATLVVLIFAGAIMLLKETPAQREAREKAEAQAQTAMVVEAEKKFDVKLPSDALQVKVTAVNQQTAFRCDGAESGGEILEFSTRLKKEQVKEHFRKLLGEGEPEYEYLDDSFDWNWTRNQKRYLLRMFSDTMSNSVYLCIVEDK